MLIITTVAYFFDDAIDSKERDERGREEGSRRERNEKWRILVFEQIFSLIEIFFPR